MSTIKFDSSGHALTVHAEWDDTLLDALLRSGAAVPFYCRAGLCGQCRSILVSGEVEDVGASPQLLTPLQRQQGEILLCRCRAVTDCEIRPANAITSVSASGWPAAAAVESVRMLDEQLLHLRIKSITGEAFDFRAGQYTRFAGMADELAAIPRLFIASRPGMPILDFYLPLNASTAAIPAMLEPGSEVGLVEPMGSASLREDTAGHVIGVAEGAGLGSLIGILHKLAVMPAAPRAHIFVYSPHRSALEQMVTQLARDSGVEAIVARAPGGLRDALDTALSAIRVEPGAAKIQAYVKVGRDMAKLARESLFAHGVRPWDTHVDTLSE
ncbi:MAG TPA: 2Fe-2S iron-sulfur cluster-binding protein [Ramlibacter sp.]|nr:2Fe-2S iron-sulfur cluster-binding protein [Ramlibacter sp.]